MNREVPGRSFYNFLSMGLLINYLIRLVATTRRMGMSCTCRVPTTTNLQTKTLSTSSSRWFIKGGKCITAMKITRSPNNCKIFWYCFVIWYISYIDVRCMLFRHKTWLLNHSIWPIFFSSFLFYKYKAFQIQLPCWVFFYSIQFDWFI